MNPTLFWSFRLSPVAVSMAETGNAHSMIFLDDCVFDVCMGAGEVPSVGSPVYPWAVEG